MKRVISILSALLLITALFAACGGEKPEETQPAPTLPTLDAPAATGSGGETAPEQGTKPVSTDDPFAETKDWMPGGQTGETLGNEATIPPSTGVLPGETQPAPSQPTPTEPKPSESSPVLDDSDEDLSGTATEYLDDTDEDLP